MEPGSESSKKKKSKTKTTPADWRWVCCTFPVSIHTPAGFLSPTLVWEQRFEAAWPWLRTITQKCTPRLLNQPNKNTTTAPFRWIMLSEEGRSACRHKHSCEENGALTPPAWLEGEKNRRMTTGNEATLPPAIKPAPLSPVNPQPKLFLS